MNNSNNNKNRAQLPSTFVVGATTTETTTASFSQNSNTEVQEQVQVKQQNISKSDLRVQDQPLLPESSSQTLRIRSISPETSQHQGQGVVSVDSFQSSFPPETFEESTAVSELQEGDDDNASSDDEDEYEYEYEYEYKEDEYEYKEEESDRTEYDHEASEYQNYEVFCDGCGNEPFSPLLSGNDFRDWNEKCGKLTREQISFFTNSQSHHPVTFRVEDLDIDEDDPALFMHFLQQYYNHDKEEKVAKNQLQIAIEQGIELQLPSIIDANQQLIHSRRVLKNAYVFKYLHREEYERTFENLCIFEHLPQEEFSSYMDDIHCQFHQYLEMFERFTKELSSLLSQPFINMNNLDLNDKMTVVCNAEKNLINHVDNNMCM